MGQRVQCSRAWQLGSAAQVGQHASALLTPHAQVRGEADALRADNVALVERLKFVEVGVGEGKGGKSAGWWW